MTGCTNQLARRIGRWIAQRFPIFPRQAAGYPMNDPPPGVPLAHAPTAGAPARNPAEPGGPDHARLERLARDCLRGRLAWAELELHDWLHHPDCPHEARLLAAALAARRGDRTAALDILHLQRRRPHDEPPELMQLEISLLLGADPVRPAAAAASRLYHRHGSDPAIARWIMALDVPGLGALDLIPDAAVEHLAAELLHRPELIPSLVAAQNLAPDPAALPLLRGAIERIIREFDGDERRGLELCRALAELALVARDHHDARRWALRGLALDPDCHELALVLAEARSRDGRGADLPEHAEADSAVYRAANRFPDYPDVQLAAIRIDQLAGREQAARRRGQRLARRFPNLAHRFPAPTEAAA